MAKNQFAKFLYFKITYFNKFIWSWFHFWINVSEVFHFFSIVHENLEQLHLFPIIFLITALLALTFARNLNDYRIPYLALNRASPPNTFYDFIINWCVKNDISWMPVSRFFSSRTGILGERESFDTFKRLFRFEVSGIFSSGSTENTNYQ